MIDHSTIQDAFFKQIKSQISREISMVDEIADLLHISNDSAYRRIRGETSLTFEEIGLLSNKYGISVDRLAMGHSNQVAFRYKPLDETKFTFSDYLKSLRDDLLLVDGYDNTEFIYLANDIPLFHIFGVPELTAFKYFVWTKTILNYKAFKGRKFSLSNDLGQQIGCIADELVQLYCKQNSLEIFHDGTIDSTLSQIEYYWTARLFEKAGDVVILCEKLMELVDHLCLQADYEVKFPFGQLPPEGKLEMRKGSYQLYYNEILHTDNTVLVRAGHVKMSYLTNNGHNSLFTMDEDFYDSSYKSVKNLLGKSTLISGTSEKERNRIFSAYHKKISRLYTRIKEVAY
jgi:hypothetical protein